MSEIRFIRENIKEFRTKNDKPCFYVVFIAVYGLFGLIWRVLKQFVRNTVFGIFTNEFINLN